MVRIIGLTADDRRLQGSVKLKDKLSYLQVPQYNLSKCDKRLLKLVKKNMGDVKNIDLLTQEQHDFLVNELGFKKVKTRCPVCYIEDMIRRNLKGGL